MIIHKKTISLILLTTIILLLSSAAHAERNYLVELVVFSNNSAATDEKWKADIPQFNPRKLKRAILPAAIMESFNKEPEEISKSNFSHIVQKIRNTRSRSIILSTHWVQAVGTPANTTIARITTRTNLNVEARDLDKDKDERNPATPISSNLQLEPSAAVLDGFINFYLAGQYTIEADIRYSPAHQPSILDEDPAAGPVSYRIYEKRRMKSGELNYYDHPKIGMVLRVTPVKLTETD